MGSVLSYPVVHIWRAEGEGAQLQRINENTRDNDQIADQTPSRKFLFENQIRQQHDKEVAESIDDRAVFHVYPRIGIGVQNQYTEKDEIGEDDTPVQIFKYGMFPGAVGTLLQQYLGNGGKKSTTKHEKHKRSIHNAAPP